MAEVRPRQKIRGKDEAEAETSRQGRGEAEADILRGKDEAAPNAASRCLEVPRGKAFASRTTSLMLCHCFPDCKNAVGLRSDSD